MADFMQETGTDGEEKSLIVLLCVRCTLYFEGIRSLLAGGDGAAVRFTVHDEQTLGSLKPDIIVMDENATDQRIVARYPEAKIILLCNSLETDDIKSLTSSCRIHGVISPQADAMNFRKVLEEVSKGGVWLDKDVAHQLLGNAGLFPSDGDCLADASDREKEVIRHICSGHSNKDIASMIGISERTVKAHLNRIFKKFNISSRLELVIRAMEKKKKNR
ncbi:MAG: response regulator transcription factor [Thermodesulfovibrionales bacterium]|jgi:DNA-binding NarL/FixJ family response regulator